MKTLNDLLGAPGVVCIEVQHDNDCPGAHGDPDNCVCQPEVVVHRDVDQFARSMAMNRADRRKAAREADKTMSRAAKKGGK